MRRTIFFVSDGTGIEAPNFPLTAEALSSSHLPDLLRPRRPRRFGLTIDPNLPRWIRSEPRPGRRYASLARCRREVRKAETRFRASRIPGVSTATLSIEEIASRVRQETGLERRR